MSWDIRTNEANHTTHNQSKIWSSNKELDMKLRDKFLYMSFGAGLVVLGMVLNSFLIDDADAQGSVKDVEFRNVICSTLVIQDKTGTELRGYFGLEDGDATLQIYGDDGKRADAN